MAQHHPDEAASSIQSTSPPHYGAIASLPPPSTSSSSSDSNIPPTEKAPPTSPKAIRTYWYRWGMLGIFALNLAVTNFLWITFAPIADVLRCYYGITDEIVNTLSLVGAILALILVMPASWLLIHYGIRFVTILASGFNALGGALRVGGAGSGDFSFLISGQIVQSFCGLMGGSFTLFSEVWFPASERATATAVAALAPQVSAAIKMDKT